MDSVLASFCVLNLADVFPADPARVQCPQLECERSGHAWWIAPSPKWVLRFF